MRNNETEAAAQRSSPTASPPRSASPAGEHRTRSYQKDTALQPGRSAAWVPSLAGMSDFAVRTYSAAIEIEVARRSLKLISWRYLIPSSAMSSPTIRSPSPRSSSMSTYMA